VRVHVRSNARTSKRRSGGYLKAYGSGYQGSGAGAYDTWLEVRLEGEYEATKVRVKAHVGDSTNWLSVRRKGKIKVGVYWGGSFYGSSLKWITSSDRVFEYELPASIRGKRVRPAIRVYDCDRGDYTSKDVYVNYWEVYVPPRPPTVEVDRLIYVVNPSDSDISVRLKLLSGSGLRDMELRMGGEVAVKVEGGTVVKGMGSWIPLPAHGQLAISLRGTEDDTRGYLYSLAVECSSAGRTVDEITFTLRG